MSLQINRSFAAISDGALRSYHSNQTTMGKAITRVSTGKRINTAADDVGAYASSHKLKADSDAYNALYRGVQSGATYLNAADKAMTSIVDMLTSMREKALEYQTTDNDTQKTVLENEFKALYDAAKTAVYTKVGTNDSLLTKGGSFSFVTGLQAGDSEDVDLSNVPTEAKTFTASTAYTYSNVNKSSIAYYKAANGGTASSDWDKDKSSTGSLVIADNTYTLSVVSSNNKLTNLVGEDVGEWYAILDANQKVVGAYDSGTGALSWDIRSFKGSNASIIATSNFQTITDANVTAVSNTSEYHSESFNVTAFSFDPTKSSNKINIDGVELTLTNKNSTDNGEWFEVTGTINSNTSETNGAMYSGSNIADAHVGHYKFNKTDGTLEIKWDGNYNSKYLVDGQNDAQGASTVHIVSDTSYFASGTTQTYTLMRDFTASKPANFTIQQNTLNFKGDSGTVVVTDDATGDFTTYNLATDGYVYNSTDMKTALGSWKVSNSDGELTINWGNPETAGLSFSVNWDGIQQYLQDTANNGKDFDITSTDTAKKLATAIDKVTEQQSQIGGGINALEYISNHLSNLASVQEEAYTTLTESDMAAEMTNYVKSNIYSQAAQAMIAQANQSLAQVLNLLQ